MAGLTQGLEGGQKGPLDALTSMSKQMTAAGTLALGATAMPAFAVDNTPPISSSPSAAVYDSHDTYQITIQAGPGTDMLSLEKSLRAIMARIENEKKSAAAQQTLRPGITTMMMALGMFVFSLRTAAYQELQRQTDWRHASNNRIGAAPRGNSLVVAKTPSPSPASSSPNWPALHSASTRFA